MVFENILDSYKGKEADVIIVVISMFVLDCQNNVSLKNKAWFLIEEI